MIKNIIKNMTDIRKLKRLLKPSRPSDIKTVVSFTTVIRTE